MVPELSSYPLSGEWVMFMRSIAAVIMLLSTASFVAADERRLSSDNVEWSEVGETDIALVYLNEGTIRATSQGKQAWVLANFKDRIPGPTPGSTVASRLALYEFHCAELRFRSLATFWYSEPKGAGEVLDTDRADASWSYPSPHSVLFGVLSRVCG